MPRRPCLITQSLIERTIRAAKQTGARVVKIDPDGTIWINPASGPGENPQDIKNQQVAVDREAVL